MTKAKVGGLATERLGNIEEVQKNTLLRAGICIESRGGTLDTLIQSFVPFPPPSRSGRNLSL